MFLGRTHRNSHSYPGLTTYSNSYSNTHFRPNPDAEPHAYAHPHTHCATYSYSAMQRVPRCPGCMGRWESDVRDLPLPNGYTDTQAYRNADAAPYTYAKADRHAYAASYHEPRTAVVRFHAGTNR